LSHLTNDNAGVASQFRNEVHWHANRVCQRLVLVPDDQRQRVEEVDFPQQQFMMVRSYLTRYQAGIRKLARVALVLSVIADGEGLDWLSVAFGKQGCVGARVDAAGEEYSHWYITDLAEPNASSQF